MANSTPRHASFAQKFLTTERIASYLTTTIAPLHTSVGVEESSSLGGKKKIVKSYYGVDSNGDAILVARLTNYEGGDLLLLDYINEIKITNKEDFFTDTRKESAESMTAFI